MSSLLGITGLTTSKDAVEAFSAFTLTCVFSTDITTGVSVAWNDGSAAVTDGVTTTTGQSLLSVASATKDNNLEYTCAVTFATLGTTESTKRQYVRLAEADSTAYGIDGGTTTTLTCKFYGDAVSAIAWTFKGATLADGSDYGVTKTDATGLTTGKLAIKSLGSSTKGTYTCTATYTSDSATSAKEIRVEYLGNFLDGGHDLGKILHSWHYFVQH